MDFSSSGKFSLLAALTYLLISCAVAAAQTLPSPTSATVPSTGTSQAASAALPSAPTHGATGDVPDKVTLESLPGYGSEALMILMLLAFLGGVAYMTKWFLDVFTTDLKGDLHDKETKDAVSNMVYFCYCFTFISLAAFALPFTLLFMPAGMARATYGAMIESPIAVGLGCVHDMRAEHTNWEVVCQGKDRFADEWLINIGGNVLAISPSVLGTSTSPVTDTPVAAAVEWLAPDQPIDQHLTGLRYLFPRIIVHGGLTVPFYFVFMSLLGAAISMTRRIPEIQSALLNAAEPAFQPPQARQKMVFQILQFVSAPFIAIAAYVLLTPESPTTSVALAFASGFSSEMVLRGISYVANQFEEFASKDVKTFRSLPTDSPAGATKDSPAPPSQTDPTIIGASNRSVS